MIPGNTGTIRIDLAGGAVALCVLGALAYFSVVPVLRERDEANARRLELASLQRETDAALEALRSTSRRLTESRGRAEALPARLRTRQDLNVRIAEIVAQADDHDLAMVTILPGDPERAERYTRTPIEMTMRGSTADLARYLHDLHKTATDLEITNLEITTGADGIDVVIRAEWITLTR